jgi:hypothetical protein
VHLLAARDPARIAPLDIVGGTVPDKTSRPLGAAEEIEQWGFPCVT